MPLTIKHSVTYVLLERYRLIRKSYALRAHGDRSNVIEVTPAVVASNQRFGVFGLALGELANPELRKKGK